MRRADADIFRQILAEANVRRIFAGVEACAAFIGPLRAALTCTQAPNQRRERAAQILSDHCETCGGCSLARSSNVVMN